MRIHIGATATAGHFTYIFPKKNIVIYEHCMNRKKFTKTASSRSQCKDLMGWVSTRVTKTGAKSHTKKSENFSQFFSKITHQEF
jgi:hypothetical protein